MIHDILLSPFVEFDFMRRALVGCLALALSAAPIGVFMTLRRMSLTGDALSHAVLPGTAIGYLVAGLSPLAMTIGGVIAGSVVALLAGWTARVTAAKEDSSLAAFYLVSLALGVLIVSTRGSSVDLLHVLFGTVLALDDAAILLLGGIATLTLIALAVLYRPLVMECLDPAFLRNVSRLGPVAHYGFMLLMVLNLVGGFHALGTLMSVGLMILPASAARFWTNRLTGLLAIASLSAFVCTAIGLLTSFHLDLPAGPAIILVTGLFYLCSLAFGRYSAAWAFIARHFASRESLNANLDA